MASCNLGCTSHANQVLSTNRMIPLQKLTDRKTAGAVCLSLTATSCDDNHNRYHMYIAICTLMLGVAFLFLLIFDTFFFLTDGAFMLPCIGRLAALLVTKNTTIRRVSMCTPAGRIRSLPDNTILFPDDPQNVMRPKVKTNSGEVERRQGAATGGVSGCVEFISCVL